MGWKVLSGNDNIHNEAHYVVSNITFFLKNAEFDAASINISPLSLSVVQKRFLDSEIKYKIIKFCFAPKLPSICIKNIQWVNGFLHIL